MNKIDGKAALALYGMKQIATVNMVDDNFVISITDPSLLDKTCCIYAFVIGDEIVRIGSSKGVFKCRLRRWEKDITGALAGKKTDAPLWDAQRWAEALRAQPDAALYAREGTEIETPIGRLNAYLAEESELIGRYLPKFNRSKHR